MSARNTTISVLGFRQKNFKSAKPSTQSQVNQTDSTLVKNSFDIPQQLTAASHVPVQLVSKKESFIPNQSVSEIQETAGINAPSNGPIHSFPEEQVPVTIRNLVTSSNGKFSKREALDLDDERAEHSLLLVQSFVSVNGPLVDIKRTFESKSPMEPKHPKSTWTRISRGKKERPTSEILMLDAENHTPSPTMVLLISPPEQHELYKLDLPWFGKTTRSS